MKCILIFILYFVTELASTKLYIISTKNDDKLKLLSEKFKQFLLNGPKLNKKYLAEDTSREDKNKCDRHFDRIFGTKAIKTLCLDFYEDRKSRKGKESVKRKRTEIKEPIIKNPFSELSRDLIKKTFSVDYVDLKDFVRSMDEDEFSKDYLDVGDLVRYDPFEARRALPYETKLNKNKVQFRSRDSSSEESDEGQNRFKIIENDSSESESGSEEKVESKEESGDEKEENEAKIFYFQGRNRLVKDSDGRKRMQHFLPKRFHWSEDDMNHLGYYWFDGPRGRIAEAVDLL